MSEYVCELSEASLRGLEAALEAMASGMDARARAVEDDMAEVAVRTASAVLGGVQGIELSRERGDRGVAVTASGELAAFREFGTGVVGRGTYPGMGGEPWPYDERRTPEAHDPDDPTRWYYYDAKGKRRSTRGQPAKPFMLPAAEAAAARAEEAVRRAMR